MVARENLSEEWLNRIDKVVTCARAAASVRDFVLKHHLRSLRINDSQIDITIFSVEQQARIKDVLFKLFDEIYTQSLDTLVDEYL